MDSVKFRGKILGGILTFFGKFPLGFLYGIGGFGSWFIRSVLGYRRNVVYTNLARSFPDMTFEQIEAVARGYYSRIGEIAAETIWFGGCKGRKGAERIHRQHICEYVNLEVLREAAKDRGVIVVTSHCGNWEILGGLFEFDYNMKLDEFVDINNIFIAYRPMSNKVSDYVFYENRRSPIPRYEGQIDDLKILRHAVSHRASKPIYVMITDQYPYKACHYVGRFLNQPTEGMLASFGLAAKLGFAVVYMRQERAGRGKYLISFETITPDATGQEPEPLMRRFFELLEADIRRDPVNWLWSHKRWHYDSLREEAREEFGFGGQPGAASGAEVCVQKASGEEVPSGAGQSVEVGAQSGAEAKE